MNSFKLAAYLPLVLISMQTKILHLS